MKLPCADGSFPGSASTVAASAPVATTSSEGPIEIRLVTGSDFAPFTDEGMEGGGIYTQLVQAALDAVGPQADASITFINDWGSHLDVLVPSHAFDGTFPWIRPSCDDENISEGTVMRCETFTYSEPFYENINGFVVNASSDLATSDSYEDFHDKTICLPEDYTDAILTSAGLVEPVINLEVPATSEDCIAMLETGEVDAASLEQRQATDIMGKMGVSDKLTFNPNLNDVVTLTVYVAKDNPDGEEILSLLNEGLATIRDNGVWFETVRKGFSAFYAE